MKTTDFAMIFVAIMLPIVIVVYVDIAFLLKAEEQRLYYINIINSAINDATYSMKSVEAEEQDVDYGYSGISEKKVSVNARVAVETFFKSLYNNFEIDGDKVSEDYLKSHVPALAVIDYNGVYIYSIDEYKNTAEDGYKGENYTSHILKPKRYFSYSYVLNPDATTDDEKIISQDSIPDTLNGNQKLVTVEFTMDDYISVINDDGTKTSFYLEDNNNNSLLYDGNATMGNLVIKYLKVKRSEVISTIVSEEMSVAVNKHNYYSDKKYTFTFPTMALSEWEQMVDNIGIIAFIQGINLGNVNLDYVAHGISGLKLTDRYYVSEAKEGSGELNYYHVTKDCSMYKSQNKTVTGYYMEKKDAAALGYYPCPICNP